MSNQSTTSSQTQTIGTNGQQITIALSETREVLPEPTKATGSTVISVLYRSLLLAWTSAVVCQSLSYLPWATVTKERIATAAVASALIVAGVDAAQRKATRAGELTPSASYAASVIAGTLLIL